MKKFVWPLLVIFFLLGGLAVILIGKVALPPEPRPESVAEISTNWFDSGHSDFTAEAFVHWDEEDPAVVPASCAKCHSAYGYLDYLGQDGTTANVVDNDANIGSVVTCYTCHNPASEVKTTALFPSGAEIEVPSESTNCVECHQGTRSGVNVATAIADLPEDEVSEDLSFINVHYKVGGAVRYGTESQVGYEYPGQSYVGFYEHVSEYQQCADCHDPHSTEIDPQECAVCHSEVSDFADLYAIRMSSPDYDGDGDETEGISGEVNTMHDLLYQAIQQYASDVLDAPILYSSTTYPYWFGDTNGDGEASEDELSYGNSYASWSPRLLKAVYNYHMVVKDPGGFMHNASYLIQVMYDSINDLATVISLDTSELIRPE
jgi:hypothetical protein